METGKFSKTYEMTETTHWGQSNYRLTKVFKISEFKGNFYQTEETWRNSVMTYTAQYPASTDYAKDRRSDVCQF